MRSARDPREFVRKTARFVRRSRSRRYLKILGRESGVRVRFPPPALCGVGVQRGLTVTACEPARRRDRDYDQTEMGVAVPMRDGARGDRRGVAGVGTNRDREDRAGRTATADSNGDALVAVGFPSSSAEEVDVRFAVDVCAAAVRVYLRSAGA